ncbi:MAG: GYF domain-containing protein, partial [Verrucomicrobiota bacterium]
MDEADTYFIYVNEKEEGPFSRKSIVEKIIVNEIDAETPCRPSSQNEWNLLANHFQVAVSGKTKVGTIS